MINLIGKDFFTDRCSRDFWLEHPIVGYQDTLLIFKRRRRAVGSEQGDYLTTEQAQAARKMLKAVMKQGPCSTDVDRFVHASYNLRSFNEVGGHLGKGPLEHPAVRRFAIPPLSYELKQVEHDSLVLAEKIKQENSISIPNHSASCLGEFEVYEYEATLRLKKETERLENKYAHINFLTRAAGWSVDVLRVSASGDRGVQVISASQIAALKGMHTAVQRSLCVAKSDAEQLRQLRERAAPGCIQLERATVLLKSVGSKTYSVKPLRDTDDIISAGSGFRDYPIAAMRVPNLFGPENISVETACAANCMLRLFDAIATTAEKLQKKYLGPRISELTSLRSEIQQLLIPHYRLPPPLTIGGAPVARAPLRRKELGNLGNGKLYLPNR